MTHSSLASLDSVGPNGINSSGLGLTGDGIRIGQVEPRRPGDPSFDTLGTLFHPDVDPTQVFYQGLVNFDATADILSETSDHAVEVASVMISTHTTPPGNDAATGVASEAELYSIGINPVGVTAEAAHEESALATQHVANISDIRAINLSLLIILDDDLSLDGSSTYTSFIDWSAREHDVLYVSAGYEVAGGGFPIPSDNFNGITVAFSMNGAVGFPYRQVDLDNRFNLDAAGSRTSIDLIAPGRNVLVAARGGVTTSVPSGTSFAAPHVTGTVALLQEFAVQTAAADPNWGPNAHRHEVMKAVLMNSADKLKDDGTIIAEGKLLGMEKTILDTSGNNWIASDAFSDDLIPLDDEMGTGQLNAKRALQQFLPGEFDSDTGLNSVPTIGWDYGHTSFNGDFNRYLIDTPLTEGDLISITLAWDREVELTVDDGVFSAGDTFVGSSDPNTADDMINDLDLLLVEKDTFVQSLESASFVGTTEHIFAQVPFDGEFEIWVIQEDADIAGGQDYGLAWWYGVAPALAIAGDFDGNGMVDAADLAQWEGDYGINGDSDADGDGDSDGADFLVWQRNFGTGVALAANSTSVPEPAAWLLLAMGGLVVPHRNRFASALR
ncbi:MAG: S8 family serine peptidase [Planctomycetes bacterium]|nr:S8 family serine peptidase [Planctomycetota bacterium]